ncbi:MAG: HEAT repeat domain-containing protein [Desulfobulbaceae bacterium]|nr:HEAT repeat domain-containing protein [Desulfobulbaceae bacterium]
MTSITIDDVLHELRHVIAENDLIKATMLLNYIENLNAKEQNQFISVLGASKGEIAITILGRLIGGDIEVMVPQAVLRNILLAQVMEDPEQLLLLLKSDHIFRKDVFVELAGEIQLEKSIPLLEEILTSSDDLQVMKACLIALGKIGDPAPTNTLSDFLYSGHRELVIAAINALSNIDTPLSVQRLVERMGTDSDLDLIIIDALANLEDSLALDHLNKELASQHAYIRTHVKKRLAKIGAKAIPMLIENLKNPDQDFVVHSLNVLGYIGDESAVRAVRKLLHNEPADANVRFAAYESLGMMPLAKGAYVLAEGLTDPVDQVRIAAAKAIEWNCDDILIAGVQNLIRQGGADARHVVEAFLNSESHKIVFSAIDLEGFQQMTIDFLTSKAHPDLKNRYEVLFREKGYTDLADKLLEEEVGELEKLLVFAVDDSRMILSIYKNTLFQLGVEPQLFEFPASAIEKARETKPDIVFTDLNMPDITGIALAKQLRALYSKVELPIVMVTTQSENPDHKEAYEAGIDMIVSKPFTAEDLKKAMDAVLDRGSDLPEF